jgi:hypothetical protein
LTPPYEDVEALYDASAERLRSPDYPVDLQLAETRKHPEKSPATTKTAADSAAPSLFTASRSNTGSGWKT